MYAGCSNAMCSWFVFLPRFPPFEVGYALFSKNWALNFRLLQVLGYPVGVVAGEHQEMYKKNEP